MSCPDWSDLTAHRRGDERSAAAAPEGWNRAMDHLEGCADCRDRALAADPTLLFRRLPSLEVSAGEIADMRAGVAALRRAGRVTESPAARRPAARALAAGASAWWGRAAAAAILAIGLLSLQPGLEERAPEALFHGTTPLTAEMFPFDLEAEGMATLAWLDEAGASAVDDIENPTASVYHFDDEEVAVVMVVDAGLDV
jgi:hypothetical protein